jgi:hypothetical protein
MVVGPLPVPTLTTCVVDAVAMFKVVALVDPMLSVVPAVSTSLYTFDAVNDPLPSRQTMELLMSEEDAVVAEFDTFPAVCMVASLVSCMAAPVLMFASVITSDAICVFVVGPVTWPEAQ